MAAFPVLELNHPTLLNLIAIGCYTIAMLFHVISFTTDNWSYMRLEGIPWKMGLWRGCKQHADKSWNCTSAVFDDKVFQTGSDWHSGTQVMMTLALIALFLLEFAIICYVCIKRMEVHRDRVTGVVLGLSLTAAFCHFLTLIMYGSEVAKIPEAYVLGSYALVVLCMLFEIAIPVLVLFDKSKRFPSDHVFIVTHVKRKANAARKSKPEPEVARRSEHRQEEPPDGEPGHHRISMSTRGPETLKKFAPYIIEDHAPSIARTSKEFRWSTPSLADGRRRDSSGSSASHNTQTTMFTNVSYDMSVDRDSVESLV